VKSRKARETIALLRETEPEDLIQFGLIPELIGRVPLVVALDELDDTSLLRILTEPKNAITRQFEYLFSLDGLKLRFEEEALREVVRTTIRRKTGARGLRAVLESTLLETMYQAPDLKGIAEIVVTRESVQLKGLPVQVPIKSPRAQNAA
jgi:ATP-dependent Clp protease ATP-binding subunit ClpX